MHIPGALSSNEITLIGFVPQGGFHMEKGGWSGAAQFSTVKNIIACSYGVINVKASNTAAELAAEDVTYVINKNRLFRQSKEVPIQALYTK